MKEKLAAMLVLLATLGIPGLLFWYQGFWQARQTAPGVRALTLTALGGGSGVYTLEEVNGLNYWWREFTPATLYLNRGERVVLTLQSADVTHRFYVPELGLGPVEIRPGHPQRLEFVATRAGLFQYFCVTVCGPCHHYMNGWIVVAPTGEAPPAPALACPDCSVRLNRPPDGVPLALGEYLYLTVGCVACHGAAGRGGVPNLNYAKQTVPAHDRTAEKLFLQTPEDAAAFLDFLTARERPRVPEEIPMAPLVADRYRALTAIIRSGSQPQRADPGGPEPPLWMPAWCYRLDAREIDALVAYFVSLEPWGEEP